MKFKYIAIAISLVISRNLNSFALPDFHKYSQSIYELLPDLKKDINVLVLDTKILYSHVTTNFENISSCSKQIQEASDVFEKIDLGLNLLDKQFVLVTDIVEILNAASKPIRTSSKLISPFFPSVAQDGLHISENMESIAGTILKDSIILHEIIKPLRESIDKIVDAFKTLQINLKVDELKRLDEGTVKIMNAAKKFKAITRKYGIKSTNAS